MLIYVDIDNTICHTENSDYENSKPRQEQIDKINSEEHKKNYERLPNYPDLLDKLIVTKGKYGCEYKEKIYPTEEVPVKDVSGAGDTFLAGLVSEYVKSKDINKAIEFAQQCTTEVVQKHGVSTI